MQKRTLILSLLMSMTVATIAYCGAGCCAVTQPCAAKPVLDDTLAKLDKAVGQLKTYQADILWQQTEPLLESVTIRKGRLYYAADANSSKLRINFLTIKQDDSDEEKHIEHFIFDGVWLTRVDYQNKTINYDQLTPENRPIKAFDMVSRHFPIIGFTKVDQLKKDFKISYIEPENGENGLDVQLRLAVEPNSTYKNDYAGLDFWIDANLNLPSKITAKTVEADEHTISLTKVKMNKKLKNSVFGVEKPSGFSENKKPIQQN